MKNSFKNILTISLIMFGTLVGAGFASGKEIWVYFARIKSISFLNIFITAFLFILCSLFRLNPMRRSSERM